MYEIHESYLLSTSQFSLCMKWKPTRTKCMPTRTKCMPTRTKAKPTRTSQLRIRGQHERIRKQLNLDSSLVQTLQGPSVNQAYCNGANRPIARYRAPKRAIGP